MIIKGKNISIKLNVDGSYLLDGKNYIPREGNSKQLYHQISLIGNKDELKYEDLPDEFRHQIYKNLMDINKNVSILKERDKIHTQIEAFGFDLSEKFLDNIQNINAVLYKAGFCDTDFNKDREKLESFENFRLQNEIVEKLYTKELQKKFQHNFREVSTYIADNYGSDFYKRSEFLNNTKEIEKKFKHLLAKEESFPIISISELNDIYATQFNKIKAENYIFMENFIYNYKEKNYDDFKLFNSTAQELLKLDTKEVLRLYNDKIDESFVLDSDEYNFINKAKQNFISMQTKILEDAVTLGVEIPKEMPRFKAPSNKFKDIIVNPQKAKMIEQFDFKLYDKVNETKSKYINKGVFDDESKDRLSQLSKKGLRLLNIDTNNSTLFITTQIIKHGGFDFDLWKQWAMSGENNSINNVSDAYQAINNGLLHCNKLVECGILKNNGEGKFEFTSIKARDILFENPDADYVKLADLVINEMNITFDANAKIKKQIENILDIQKSNFFEYLDAQFESYYAPQGLEKENFFDDLLHTKNNGLNDELNGEEFNYCKDMFPELFKSVDFKDLIDEYKLSKTYRYERDENIDSSVFENANKKYTELRKEFSDTKGRLSEGKEKVLIDLAMVKSDGVISEKIKSFKSFNEKNGINVDEYLKKVSARGIELVEAGLMDKDKKGNLYFKDTFAKSVLAKNPGAKSEILAESNRGTKVLISDEQNSKESVKVGDKLDGKYSVDGKDIYKLYETMSDNDKIKHSDMLSTLFHQRQNQIQKILAPDDKFFNKNRALETLRGQTVGNSIFGIKDNLQPLDEFIREIKESKGYKKYQSKHAIKNEVDTLIQRYENFNFNYKYSKNSEYKKQMMTLERDLEKNFLLNINDDKIKEFLDSREDVSRGEKKFLKQIELYRVNVSEDEWNRVVLASEQSEKKSVNHEKLG